MRTTDLTTTGGNDQFYPTPPDLAEKMLEGIDFCYIESVLEPSAGKGDLILALMKKYMASRYRYGDRIMDIDACEIDPYLRQILKYNFSEEKLSEARAEREQYRMLSHSQMTEAQRERSNQLENEAYLIRKTGLHIVNDDFMTYRTYKHYDLILMNPPFADGDKHLLRAIEMQKDGGKIVCLLNAETLRNPFTPARRLLQDKLAELSAEVEFVEDAFADAERRADVDVAIIRITVPTPEPEESGIWERMRKAAAAESIPDAEITALVVGDYIEQAIQRYNTEVSATMELLRQYTALMPYISRTLNPEDKYDRNPIVYLVVGTDNYTHGFDLDKYMRTVRLKYWEALFSNEEFTGRLTSKLRETYRKNVERMADYDFSAFNIKQILLEMNASMTSGVQQAILDLFEKFTAEHTWHPECKQNIHYFNGWATNKAHMVGKKVIVPTNVFDFSYFSKQSSLDHRRAYAVISDLEKAFDYLGGKRPDGYDLSARLSWAEQGSLRNVELAYFKVDFFKKGTIHIKFYPETMPLVERLNIYAARNRNWLPPSYGRAAYRHMSKEEKAVVDSFHGDGTEGSGETAYSEVMAKSNFFLADPAAQSTMPLLAAAT